MAFINVDQSSLNRPAAVIRLAALLVALLASGCASPPVEVANYAWMRLQESERRGAAESAPEILGAARRQYDLAWRVISSENQRIFFVRNFAVAESLFFQAADGAATAVRVAEERRERHRRELEGQIEELRDRLALHRDESDYHLRRVPLRRALTLAELKLAAATSDVQSSTPEQAQLAVESAEEAIATLQTLMEDDYLINGDDPKLWEEWIRQTVAWSRRTDSAAVVVIKKAHQAHLLKNGKVVRTFPVDLGYRSGHQKSFSGDAATPEGVYRVTKRRDRGSKFYKALNLDYPNEDDRARFNRARRSGRISSKARIGGNIEIHGDGGRGRDWTDGCVALSNEDIDLLMPHVDAGTRVTIVRDVSGWPK